MSTHRGFSLIELLIVVALLGFLMMLAAPFGTGWAESAQVRQAEGLLNLGIGRAKATALRNRFGMIDTQPAALLCVDQNRVISLHEANSAASPASCSSTQLWSAQLPKRVAVKTGGSDFQCLAFDARALATSVNGCSQSQTFALAAGKENVELTFN